MGTLLAALLFSAVDGDEAPSRFRLGLDITSAAVIETSVPAIAALAAGLEVGVLPWRYLRIRGGGRAAWSLGASASLWVDGGLDAVIPTWWGEVYFGAAGGALYAHEKWLPTVSGRGGVDLLLARPLYVGIGASYAFAVATTHVVALNLRLGLAF